VEVGVFDISADVGDVTTCVDPSVLPDTYVKVTLNGDSRIWDLEEVSGGESFAQITQNDLELFIRMRTIFPFDSTSINLGFFNLMEGQNDMVDQGTFGIVNFNGLFNLGENVSVGCVGICDQINVFVEDIGDVGGFVTGTISSELEAVNVEFISITPGGVSFYPLEPIGDYLIEVEFRVLRTQ